MLLNPAKCCQHCEASLITKKWMDRVEMNCYPDGFTVNNQRQGEHGKHIETWVLMTVHDNKHNLHNVLSDFAGL